MAFIPQFYSNYTFPSSDITEFPPQGVAEVVNGKTSIMDVNTMWGQDNMNFIQVHDHNDNNNGALDHVVPQDWDTMSSAWMPDISDCKMGFFGGIGSFQNFSCGYQPHIGDFEEDIKPPNIATGNWYACRKTLADRRVRVRGRFARNNIELSEEDKASKNCDNNHKEDFLYGDDSIQFKLKVNNDDDWLYEAMASLVYLSHSSPDDM
ncbi:hypothetical protein RIF29_30750 [Crotalaria pallida]|uniref:CCT domain-containing protein n=1 Tax=Crotalaria pallida TaxID=3830 RepID=A0AAN9ELP4_CROPI